MLGGLIGLPAVAQQEVAVKKVRIGELPAIYACKGETRGKNLVIWLPGFSGAKEGTEGQLKALAEQGFVGLCFDPYQHGERRIEPNDQLRTRVRGNIRRFFWPILAKTAEEVPSVIDWCIRELGVSANVGIGGTSMGGDISVAAAGVDRRIRAVAALVGTPDWMRPGSFEPPGEPDEAAQKDYDRRNPLTHLNDFRHHPAITFESGAVDMQVPPDGGQRFVAALLEKGIYPKDSPLLRVTLHPGVPHRIDPKMIENAMAWFKEHLR